MSKTSSPTWCTKRFSPGSTLRMPIWRSDLGLSAGTVPPISIKGCGPCPHRQATGMPCTLPLGVSTLVLKSAWASSHSTRSFLPASRQKRATALMLPMPRQWSPPSRIGSRSSRSSASTASCTSRFQATTSFK